MELLFSRTIMRLFPLPRKMIPMIQRSSLPRLMRAAFPIIGLGLLYGVGWSRLGTRALIGDEWAHLKQAQDLIALVRTGAPFHPVHPAIPGYHALLALVGLATGATTVEFFRGISLLLSAATVVAFYLAARQLGGKSMLLVRTAQFVFLPIAFPFVFLLYTDVPSLLPILLCVWALTARRYGMAGLAAIATVAMRQNNVIWILLFLLLTIVREWKGWSLRSAAHVVKKAAPMGVSVLLLALFILWNGGIALADRGAHPFAFRIGNVVILCSVFVSMFLPLVVLQQRETVWRMWQVRQWIVPAGVLAFLLFMLLFRNDHGYNFDAWWMRNKMLLYFTRSVWHQWFYFFAFIVPAGVIAWRTPLLRKDLSWFYPFTVLYLGASWLVEPRYFFVPLTLFLLFRKMERPLVEGVILMLCIGQAIALYYAAWQGMALP
jgi:alpha-1,2-glucosyltransferase